MTRRPGPHDILFITQYAFKIIDSMPDNTTEIKLMGDILYSYYISHPEIAEPDTPILSYDVLTAYNEEIVKILYISDNELTVDGLNNKQNTTTFNRFFESYFMTHSNLPININNNLDLSRFSHLENLYLYKIYCRSVHKIPSTLKYLYCRSCNMFTIGKIPKTLIILNCSENRIRRLPQLYHAKLLSVFCNENKIRRIPKLSNTVEWLYCYSNNIYELPSILPSALEFLSCSNNELTDIPNIPPKLIGLYLEHNYIRHIPPLPKTLIDFFFADNKVAIMPELPPFLKRITCNSNPLREYNPFPPSVQYANIDGKLMDISPPIRSIPVERAVMLAVSP